MSDANGFQFVPDPNAWQPADGMVARIPMGVRSQEKLLAILADRLRFPAWSGRNWDALEELLRDLSWLPPGAITLVHQDLPFGPGGENRGIYLSILSHSCRSWPVDASRKLSAVFPASLAEAVASALTTTEQ